MAVTLLTTTADPYQKSKVRLDGKDYVLTLAYNQRADRWSLSIADDVETPILSGLKLVSGWPLLYRYRYNPSVPPGELWVLELANPTDSEPPGLTELGEGKRCELTYFGVT